MATFELATQVGASLQKFYFETTTLIQKEKVRAGGDLVRRAQDDGNLPKDTKELIAAHTSLHRNNIYRDYDRFQTYMVKSPKLWKKRFYYASKTVGSVEQIVDAATMAVDIVARRTLDYPDYDGPVDKRAGHPGFLMRSITMMVNGEVTTSPENQLRRDGAGSVFELTNTAPYASTAEARSYLMRNGGIIFYAANRVQRAFPQLGVLFTYSGSVGISTGHKYAIPLLVIGPRDQVDGKWATPGDTGRRGLARHRRLKRTKARLEGKFNGT